MVVCPVRFTNASTSASVASGVMFEDVYKRQVLTPEDFLFKSEPGEMAPLETLEDMEQEMIRKALVRHEGNLSAVACRLGITRQTLYNKMKKFNL